MNNCILANQDILCLVCKHLSEKDIQSLFLVSKSLHDTITHDKEYLYSICRKTYEYRVKRLKSQFDMTTAHIITSEISAYIYSITQTEFGSIERVHELLVFINYLSKHQDYIHSYFSAKIAYNIKLRDWYFQFKKTPHLELLDAMNRLYVDLFNVSLIDLC